MIYITPQKLNNNPITLRLNAGVQAAGIYLSQTLKDALDEKLAEGAPTATNRSALSATTPCNGGARQ